MLSRCRLTSSAMPVRGPKRSKSLASLRLTDGQEQSFWRHVRRTRGCWLWTGSKNRWGYGVCAVGTEWRVSTRADGTTYRRRGKTRLAHRVSYRLVVGPIPAGLDLDHVRANGCRSKACVKPSHLEPLPSLENCIRDDIWRVNRNKTHCPQGHPYVEENVRRFNGSRSCIACNREACRRRRAA